MGIHRTPLVLGTSLFPVLLMASRIASANALNADSDLAHRHQSQAWSKSRASMRTCGGRFLPEDNPHAKLLQQPWQKNGIREGSFLWTDLQSFPGATQD